MGAALKSPEKARADRMGAGASCSSDLMMLNHLT